MSNKMKLKTLCMWQNKYFFWKCVWHWQLFEVIEIRDVRLWEDQNFHFRFEKTLKGITTFWLLTRYCLDITYCFFFSLNYGAIYCKSDKNAGYASEWGCPVVDNTLSSRVFIVLALLRQLHGSQKSKMETAKELNWGLQKCCTWTNDDITVVSSASFVQFMPLSNTTVTRPLKG